MAYLFYSKDPADGGWVLWQDIKYWAFESIPLITIFSTSLNPDSRSRILARAAAAILDQMGAEFQFLDLSEVTLPICDASYCYAHPNVVRCIQAIESSSAIFVATPVYNYDVSASAKNLVELTGRAWSDKVVALLAAAGGSGSYMSLMGLANSLMLDFHSLIVPRFVFATGSAFEMGELRDPEIAARVLALVGQTLRISTALTQGREAETPL
ncbi:MAG TPA: NAD(P)H-dependent oxidoreductase [Pirellulaceae bacterium]|nr:NAD(P)H-dependent oxidoreductase [Pirellulaceae bacterium]